MAVSSHHSFIDRCLLQFDQALRTCVPGSSLATRSSPADTVAEEELSAAEKKHIVGLMRINHTGEVCAQALYAGQAATARLDEVRESMDLAAQEEADHLAWCDERLKELDSHPSLLNPLWYGLSFGMGAIAGLAGDKWSLGFVAETEDQVCKHLEDHLTKLPEQDGKSKAILEQMIKDERQHGETAKEAGGADLPLPAKKAMTTMSQVMKKTAYHV
ncbi:MAG: 2-polyprenyl-3-methyl-6-methoxy-1,4-benzoquinone monooxygenase [Pseudomonadota bacterium]|jgi:ubiquinone biosynthesis monooxygenase Coq7|nr:2-polyprenyl-3-methyl-6-methoxy-1,4-benzoquinone monooxygenase [Pseudomonadota bacterium]